MNGTGVSWRQVRVGAVITIALGVLAISIFFVGETGTVFGERYSLTTLMPSANGLIEGANVRVAGQDVGKVARIEFIAPDQRPEPDDVLELTLSINRSVRDQIRADSEARIRTQGLLGDKIIDITPGSPGSEMLQDGDTLRTSVAVDYEQIIASGAELVEDLSAMLGTLRVIADSLVAGHGTAGRLLTDTTLYVELLGTSRALNDFLTAVGRGEGALGQLARDDELYSDLRSAIAGLDSLTYALLEGEGTLSLLITEDSLYRRLVSTSARADSLLGSLESGQGTLGQMLTDQRAYEELLKLVVDVQTLIRDLQEEPRKYVPPIRIF